MSDRKHLWQRAESAEFPALDDSAVRLFADADRAEPATPPYSGLPTILRMVTPRHPSIKPSIARWAPELCGHEAPMVSRDGRGE
jgi:hypothetical protein